MKGELTAVIEAAPEGGFWAICLEIPGTGGWILQISTHLDEEHRSIRAPCHEIHFLPF